MKSKRNNNHFPFGDKKGDSFLISGFENYIRSESFELAFSAIKTPTHTPGSLFFFKKSTYLPSLEKVRLRLLPEPDLFPENPLKREFPFECPEPLEFPLFLFPELR